MSEKCGEYAESVGQKLSAREFECNRPIALRRCIDTDNVILHNRLTLIGTY
ncbi:MAG: hypothetical protein LBT46_08525 [Planctomycetaceae bacterium]|nr:hypothetical protein [Planctomycetaceae bacterium]